MMTPKEASQLSIKMAGYGIKDTVVIAIQEDARKTSLETDKIMSNYLADNKYNGTLERRIAIILDNEIIGQVKLASGSMEKLTEKIVKSFRESPEMNNGRDIQSERVEKILAEMNKKFDNNGKP
jgi:hypothetical protein